jgi:hypothetical protein
MPTRWSLPCHSVSLVEFAMFVPQATTSADSSEQRQMVSSGATRHEASEPNDARGESNRIEYTEAERRASSGRLVAPMSLPRSGQPYLFLDVDGVLNVFPPVSITVKSGTWPGNSSRSDGSSNRTRGPSSGSTTTSISSRTFPSRQGLGPTSISVPSLLIAPDARTGLLPRHLDAVDEFVRQHGGDPEVPARSD